MKKEAYILANEIKAVPDGTMETVGLTDMERVRYKSVILKNIRNKENPGGKKTMRIMSRRIMAAACAAALFLSVLFFRGNVYAAIEHIRWNIGNALGLSGDLADYREIVDSSVTDNGYIVTLQEAVATEEKIVINYTIQRADGQPMERIPSSDDTLYINGKRCDGASGGGGFLDEAQTTAGVAVSYHIFGADMSGQNAYRLKIRSLDMENEVRGKWDFEFTADGTDLIADTKRIPIQKEFVTEDGVDVTLEELALNELEQRISYRTAKDTDYIFKLVAEDSAGRQVQFDTQTYRGKEGAGTMINAEILYDGRIDENAGTVKMTLYAVKMPEGSGRMSDDYVQVGETFEIELDGGQKGMRPDSGGDGALRDLSGEPHHCPQDSAVTCAAMPFYRGGGLAERVSATVR